MGITLGAVRRDFYKTKYLKMSGVMRDAPIGIQCVHKISGWLCPRLQINRLRWYQGTVLVLTYLTYMTYHLTRKPISVVKSVLHRNCSELPPPPGVDPADDQWCNWAPFNTTDANTLLGALDSAFLFSYAAAMFVSGMVAERVSLRYFLSLGMAVSAFSCWLFGAGRTLSVHTLPYYLMVQAAAGIAQTTGWPGTVAVVGRWFGGHKQGLIFGIWNSHTSLGNILGTLIAARYVESDWSLSFAVPALVMGALAVPVLLLLPEHPRVVNMHHRESSSGRSSRRSSGDEDEQTPVVIGDQAANLRSNRHSTNAPPPRLDEASESTALLPGSGPPAAISLSRALAIPGVLEFSMSLFFAKLVSYTFLYWLPLYINTSTHLTPQQSGDLSTVFDVGGVAGAVAAGLVSDVTGAPGIVCVFFYTLCAPTLLAYQRWGASSWGANVALLVAGGAFVNAPYALITTAVSTQLGTHSSVSGNSRALATVTAIIDGTGSVGAAIGPMLAGVVSSTGQWAHVFYMLIGCNCMALVLLLRIVKKEIHQIRQNRRMASPRSVRIE